MVLNSSYLKDFVGRFDERSKSHGRCWSQAWRLRKVLDGRAPLLSFPNPLLGYEESPDRVTNKIITELRSAPGKHSRRPVRSSTNKRPLRQSGCIVGWPAWRWISRAISLPATVCRRPLSTQASASRAEPASDPRQSCWDGANRASRVFSINFKRHSGFYTHHNSPAHRG